ncbi:putative flippase GtrA [Roseivirga ehrenbergii]|uniref:Glycosyl transferase family 2 n=1 Tax=Roseivirga ehrenbergii (strain DSM 102268 / JCM 13514 / KCTC 12282 / NCIMB 14502 / KMM 6017) TaxID=279360 RepID=A0A150X010_ROSEK|nr:GtrA family protein [Roseivirga ehrenbergii]KYG71996.1 glycosyl transferase family 2 [Roseivirga ehrenbergii]TCL13212.1 putative flippase GtrA [Roseivirga ehrenbergii]
MFELGFKFLKFSAVGLSGLAIDFCITFLAKEKLRLNKYFANSLGFVFAATSNYLLNKTWTFQDTNPYAVTQFSKYILIALIGLIINNLIIYLLVNKKEMSFYWAKLVAIGIVVLWNFIANYNFTFVAN